MKAIAMAIGVWSAAVAQNHIVVPGVLPSHWISQKSKCMEIPDWQVHEYNPDSFILRQSPCTDYEKPFIFLLFGKERALLIDTGSHNGKVAEAIARTVKLWLERNRRQALPLVVVHTHEHGDHTAGDAELKALQDPGIPVTLIPAEVEATKRFYGISNWPEENGHIDLGGRALDVIPIPGHSTASVAFYDRQTAILFSGDSLYPGRLYVFDFKAFEASVARLVRFTASQPVAHIIGNHVEQTTTPFRDYPVGTIFQPEEHELALSRGSLLELRDALESMHGNPRRLRLRDFTIWPAGPQFTTPDEISRAKAYIEEQRRTMWEERSHQ